jgi:hypothetical protein
MQADAYDLPLTTSSADAAEHYRQGVRLMLSAWPGAAAALDAAIAADPGFALAHAARGRLHAMSAEPAAAREQLALATALAPLATPREQSHVDVLLKALGGQSTDALRAVLDHAEAWPRDVLVLAMPLGAFGLFAFSGMADHDQARVDLCARHARHLADEDWWFLTTYGWALAENGEVARGRGMIETAQREIVEDTLLVAYMRAGEVEKARALLDRRLARRPSPRDTRWREDLAA